MREKLGIDFLIDGSVRLAANRVRVVVKLIDVETGTHVWGDRFDREMLDVFQVQDEIVSAVIARLAFNLDEAAQKQRQRDPASSGNAYSCFLKARAHWRNGEESLALKCAEQATEIDPLYGRAHAYIAHFYAFSLFSQWTNLGAQETIDRSVKAIEKAVSIDRTDPFILQRAALSYLMVGQPQNALKCAEAAAMYSACDSEILITRGLALTYKGDHEAGVQLLERALELEPRLAPGCTCALMEGRHMRGDYLGALAPLEHILDPPYYLRFQGALNLARLGQTEQAKRIVGEAPDGFNPAQFARSQMRMCALSSDAEHWLESFRLVGVDV
jgi:tetratricopeptide (TPR) repeat protein